MSVYIPTMESRATIRETLAEGWWCQFADDSWGLVPFHMAEVVH